MRIAKGPYTLSFTIKVLLCVVVLSLLIYTLIDRQNELTEIRREIPELQKEVRKIKEENERLQYEIESFESPILLMEISRKPEFSHLKYPYINEVIIIPKIPKQNGIAREEK